MPADPHVLPAPLVEAYRTNVAHCEDGSTLNFDSSISRPEALLLYETVRALRPQSSVEVGFAKGASCVTILRALEDIGRPATHHVLDPFQLSEWKGAGLEMVRRAGLSHRLQFHRAFAEEVIPSLEPLDFAFIDASHLFDFSLAEFILCDKKLRVGGVIGFHDLWMGAQQKLLRFILTNRHYEPIFPAGSRLSWRDRLGRFLSALPIAADILHPKLLRPIDGARFGNLFLVRKVAEDNRPTNGRHFVDF